MEVRLSSAIMQWKLKTVEGNISSGVDMTMNKYMYRIGFMANEAATGHWQHQKLGESGNPWYF